MKEIKKSNKKPKQLQEVDGEIINYSIPKWIDYLVKKVVEIEDRIDPEIIENLQSQIDALQVKVDTNTVSIADIVSDIVDINSRINVLEFGLGQEIQDRIDGDLAIQNQVDVNTGELADVESGLGQEIQDRIDGDLTIQNQANLNTENIEDLKQLIVESAQYAIEGDAVLNNPTIPEGTWTTIVWNITLNNFTNITYNVDGSFTLTEEVENLTVDIYGQTDSTGQSKEVQLRIYDVVNNTPFGGVASETINKSGSVNFVDRVTLPAGTYRYEITSSTGGGNITFTNGLLSMLKNGIGVPVDLSATFADGVNVSDVRWDSKVDEVFNGTSYTSEFKRFSDGRAVIGNVKTEGSNNGVKTSNILFSNSGAYVIEQLDEANQSTQPMHEDDRAIVLNYMLNAGLDNKVDVVDTFISDKSGITGQTRNDAQLSDSDATASINVAKISEITGANGTSSTALELKVKTDGTVSLVGKYKDGSGSFNSLVAVDPKDLVPKEHLDNELLNKIDRKWDISNPSNDITGFLDRAAEETINNATDSFLITEQVESITGAGSLTEINRRFSINVDGTFDYEVFGRRDGAVPSTPKNDWSMTPKKYVDDEITPLKEKIKSNRDTISTLLNVLDSLNKEVAELKAKIGE